MSMSLVSAAPVTVQTLNYTAVAETTEDIRLFILGNKANGQTDEAYQHEFEVYVLCTGASNIELIVFG